MLKEAPRQISHRVRSELGVEEIDGSLLILDKRNEFVHKLNPTAAIIWMAFAAGKELADIANEIVENFDISEDVARTDAISILEEFESLGLLERIETA